MPDSVVEILSAEEIRRTLTRLASQVIERTGDLSQLVLLGIYTRGVPLAHQLAQIISTLEGIDIPVGAIDITFYRDDFKTKSLLPNSTFMDFIIEGKKVVLVDSDVILVE
jgi:pyrimidine operon attenuation protein/uracil phosphoribosyltransferase